MRLGLISESVFVLLNQFISNSLEELVTFLITAKRRHQEWIISSRLVVCVKVMLTDSRVPLSLIQCTKEMLFVCCRNSDGPMTGTWAV